MGTCEDAKRATQPKPPYSTGVKGWGELVADRIMPVWVITGGAGHVGQVLAARLRKDGVSVRLLDMAAPPGGADGAERVEATQTNERAEGGEGVAA